MFQHFLERRRFERGRRGLALAFAAARLLFSVAEEKK
jgi:hypothetical protein